MIVDRPMSANLAGVILAPLVVGAALIYASTRKPALPESESNVKSDFDISIWTNAIKKIASTVASGIGDGAKAVASGIGTGSKAFASGIGTGIKVIGKGTLYTVGGVVALGTGITGALLYGLAKPYRLFINNPGPQTVALRGFLLTLAQVLYVNPDDVPPELVLQILQIIIREPALNENLLDDIKRLFVDFGVSIEGIIEIGTNELYNAPLVLRPGSIVKLEGYNVVALMKYDETIIHIEKIKGSFDSPPQSQDEPLLPEPSFIDKVKSYAIENITDRLPSNSSIRTKIISALSNPESNNPNAARFVLYERIPKPITDSINNKYFNENNIFLNNHDAQVVLIKKAADNIYGTDGLLSSVTNTYKRKSQTATPINLPPLVGGNNKNKQCMQSGGRNINSAKQQETFSSIVHTYLPLYVIKVVRVMLYQHLAREQPLGPFSWKWLAADVMLTIIVYALLSGAHCIPHMSLVTVLTDASFGMIVISCAAILMNILQSDEAHETSAVAIRIDRIMAHATPWIIAVPVVLN